MSLTQTAYISRRLIKYGGSGLVAVALLWSISVTLIKAYKVTHPKYVPPTVRYGALPKMVFPEKSFEKKSFTFEFVEDKIPSFGDQSKIYIIYRATTKILALEEAKKVAGQFGFSSEPVEVKDGIYEFKNNETTLTMNVLEGDFKLRYPYLKDGAISANASVRDKDGSIEEAASFLQSGNKYSDDLKNGTKTVSYWKIADGTMKSVSAQSEANAVRIDFYRQKLEDKWEITSPQTGIASVSVLISSTNNDNNNFNRTRVVEANFKYANIDRESFSTYPIKSTEEAIEDLKAGNYWPSSDIGSPSVVIREVKLAYYEPVTLTQYVQPIYVFKGDNNFVAFVPAVENKYVAK